MTRPTPDAIRGLPRLISILARALIRGRDAKFIATELDESFFRDIERGVPRPRAIRRFFWNVSSSIGSTWVGGVQVAAASGIGLDARLAVRVLAKHPTVTAVAVVTLGVGIPGSLALIHGVAAIYGDLPVPQAERLVGIRHFDRASNRPQRSSLQDLAEWRELTSLRNVGAARTRTLSLGGEGVEPRAVRGAEVTASVFEALRTPALLGREIGADDELPGAPPVIVVGEEVWRTHFAGDPDVIGRWVRIQGEPRVVVGVMPSGFGFPSDNSAWIPFRGEELAGRSEAGPRAFVFGRLADGIDIDIANAEVEAVTSRRAADNPARFEHFTGQLVAMTTLLSDARNDRIWRGDVLMVQLMIFGLLLVVCGNVGVLVLARTATRAREVAIRTALGASRPRILLQLFVEALILVVGATAVGLLGAEALARRIMRTQEAHGWLPYWADLTLTTRIVVLALMVAVVCSFLVGVVPALSSTGRGIRANLQRMATGAGALRMGWGSSALIVAEIALSIGFLAVGVAQCWSALSNAGADLGFDPARYVVGELALPDRDLDLRGEPGGRSTELSSVHQDLVDEISRDPAVVGVAIADDLPGLSNRNRGVVLEDAGVDPRKVEWDVATPRVGVAFFSALRRPILAGRDFQASDVAHGDGAFRRAVIVNESFVTDILGGRSAIGRRLRYERPREAEEGQWYEIVGVVGAFGTNPLNVARDAAVYHPIRNGEVNPVQFIAEVRGDPETVLHRLQTRAASSSPNATLAVGVLAGRMRAIATAQRAAYLFVVGVAMAAFLLSATGLYALLSFAVSRRTREIGIRRALGASAVAIGLLVTRRSVIQASVGLAAGVAIGWLLLDSQRTLRETEIQSVPLVLGITVLVALCVSVAACARPTLRGLRIEPRDALTE